MSRSGFSATNADWRIEEALTLSQPEQRCSVQKTAAEDSAIEAVTRALSELEGKHHHFELKSAEIFQGHPSLVDDVTDRSMNLL